MKIVLLDYESLGSDIDLSPLQKIPGFVAYRRTGAEQIEERIADADILVANALPMDRKRLEMASRLKLICVTSTGYDHIKAIAIFAILYFCTNEQLRHLCFSEYHDPKQTPV